MNRQLNKLKSAMFIKCFVPSCKNSTTKTPKKLFVFVKETLKRKWCRQVNIEYKPGRRLYCCEDHLNLEDDLENYMYWKMMNGHLKLKSTAKLRIKDSELSIIEDATEFDEAPTLKSLLLQPIDNLIPPRKIKKELDELSTLPEHKIKEESPELSSSKEDLCDKIPTESSALTYPINVIAATQCELDVMDQCNSIIKQTDSMSLLRSLLSSSSCKVTSNPSIIRMTSDTEPEVLIKEEIEDDARNKFFVFIYN